MKMLCLILALLWIFMPPVVAAAVPGAMHAAVASAADAGAAETGPQDTAIPESTGAADSGDLDPTVQDAADSGDLDPTVQDAADSGDLDPTVQDAADSGDLDMSAPGDGMIYLFDLSDIADWFGFDSGHPERLQKSVFADFNNNGEIDISDIAYVAITE